MAMNLGANDVANNMWPAVGSKAITLTGAIIIAAIFEASWALIAGWDVIGTIKWDIINVNNITEISDFIFIMISTLVGAAIWMNIATFFKAPVSATHSVIGWLVWAGLAAAGPSIVVWPKVGTIVISWIISPLMWGIIAAFFLASISHHILRAESRSEAAKIWVPVYVGIMSWVFSSYLMLKWLKKIISISSEFAIFSGAIIWIIVFMIVRWWLKKESTLLKNSKSFINSLFNVPLVFAVALLSFAHGANDVANAIGPVAAIYDIVQNNSLEIKSVGIPLWIMVVGAVWIATGLMVFGARLIKTVGNEITKLNQIRAFSVALSAAITVLIASQMGLPVSSTHIAIWWVFGVGLYRQWRKYKRGKSKQYIDAKILHTIALAWIITLPVSWSIAALSYWTLKVFS
jgi:inorganic phosphate transporter, PiT family